MNRLFQNITRTEFFIFWCIVLITSLTWSRFLLSIGIWGIVISSFFYWQSKPRDEGFQFQLRAVPQYITRWWHDKMLVALTLPFFLVLVSGLWSDDIIFWLKRVQLRLPFLVIPFAFANMPPLKLMPSAPYEQESFVEKRYIYGLLEVALLTFCLTILVVVTNYAFNFDSINKALGEGRPMPYLKAHIVFSTMASFVLMGGIKLWEEGFYWKYSFEKILIPVLTVFLFIGLHVISVRSGLVATYTCLIAKLFFIIFQRKQYLIGSLGLILLLTLPVVAYKTIPSLQQRINYAIWDLGKYQEKKPETYSDAQRIISYEMGYAVLKQNPIWGVGAGDADAEIVKAYARYYPNLPYKMPHNGWLFNAVEVGIIGLGVYIFSFFYVLFHKKRYKSDIFLFLNLIILVGMTVDYTFEGSFGATFYVFFIGLLSRRLIPVIDRAEQNK